MCWETNYLHGPVHVEILILSKDVEFLHCHDFWRQRIHFSHTKCVVQRPKRLIFFPFPCSQNHQLRRIRMERAFQRKPPCMKQLLCSLAVFACRFETWCVYSRQDIRRGNWQTVSPKANGLWWGNTITKVKTSMYIFSKQKMILSGWVH